MQPTEKTQRALLLAEQHMRSMDRKPCLVSLFIYYCSLEDEYTSIKAVAKATGLNRELINRNRRVLEEFGFITSEPGKNNQEKVTTHDFFREFDHRSLSTLSDLLLYNTISTTKEQRTEGEQASMNGFSEKDIRADGEWQKAEPILKKYFRPHQINPILLTVKKRFEMLCDLIMDELFDFEAYCAWYRKEKYPYKKFNYGLFLFPDMIAEFRDSQEEDDDTYLKTTTRIQDSESHKKGVQETEKFLKKIQEKMRER